MFIRMLGISFLLVWISACGATHPQAPVKKALTGYNINWSFLPPLNDAIINASVSLKPRLIRYPGGTIAKHWNWEDGTSDYPHKRTPHPLGDLLWLKRASGADVIFVLNMIHRSLENQLQMLRTAENMGIPIRYIEMGNEHYLGKGNNVDDSGKHQDNVVAFPTGREYALQVNHWANAIRREFPQAKIGISMFGRLSRNQRQKNWNRLIMENIDKSLFDAYVYHVYIHPDPNMVRDWKGVSTIIKHRTDALEAAMVQDNSKQKWITEYGVHGKNEGDTLLLTRPLADYTESIASISLPQVLYTKSRRTFFSLLQAPKADRLSALGEMFKSRITKTE